MTAGLDQLLATLWNHSASIAQLRDVAAQASDAVAEIDARADLAPAHEAAILARMMSPGGPSTGYVLEELRKFDDESSHRALTRKVVAAIAAAANSRVRELEAIEAAKPAEQRRREQEQAEREAKLRGLYARVPVLFKSDFVVAKLAEAAYSRTPRPVGSHVAYARTFDVPRVLEPLMAATKVPGWPPRHGDFGLIERSDYEFEEDEAIVAPLRELCEKNSPSEDEVQIAINRAQHVLINEFAQVCGAIRSHYHGELPRFVSLPSLGSPAMLAAE